MAAEIQVIVFSVRGRLLWNRWEDGIRLFVLLCRRVPVLLLVVMPDHVHLVLRSRQDLSRLHAVLQAYSLYLSRRRGARGRTWSRRRRILDVRDRAHLEDLAIYFARNPVAKGLVEDVLAWPLSLHRDMTGLALAPLCPRHPDPAALHARASAAEKRVVGRDIVGTRLPTGNLDPAGGVPFRDVAAAVSSLARCPLSHLSKAGPVRDLLFQAAQRFTPVPLSRVARFLGRDPSSASRALRRPRPPAELDLVGRVLGDPRFFLLGDGDLREDPRWRAYRNRIAPGEPPRGRGGAWSVSSR